MLQIFCIGERSGLQATQLPRHAVVKIAVCSFCLCPADIDKAVCTFSIDAASPDPVPQALTHLIIITDEGC